MASVDRAAGRIVVWAEAADDERTARISALPQNEPSTAPATGDSASPELSGLPRPMPSVPTPATAWVATVTSTYVTTSSSVEMTAERPGVTAESCVSSLVDTQVSQPRYAKIATRTPAESPAPVIPLNGLNQSSPGLIAWEPALPP